MRNELRCDGSRRQVNTKFDSNYQTNICSTTGFHWIYIYVSDQEHKNWFGNTPGLMYKPMAPPHPAGQLHNQQNNDHSIRRLRPTPKMSH